MTSPEWKLPEEEQYAIETILRKEQIVGGPLIGNPRRRPEWPFTPVMLDALREAYTSKEDLPPLLRQLATSVEAYMTHLNSEVNKDEKLVQDALEGLWYKRGSLLEHCLRLPRHECMGHIDHSLRKVDHITDQYKNLYHALESEVEPRRQGVDTLAEDILVLCSIAQLHDPTYEQFSLRVKFAQFLLSIEKKSGKDFPETVEEQCRFFYSMFAATPATSRQLDLAV